MQKIHLGSTWGEVTLQFDIRRWSTAPKVTDVTRLEVTKSTPVDFWGSTPTSRCNKLLTFFPSAYIKHQSTQTSQTSLRSWPYHQSHQKSHLSHSSRLICCFWHHILHKRLSSWFGISSTALSWIKSYLLDCSFNVNIENSKSSVFRLLYGVP